MRSRFAHRTNAEERTEEFEERFDNKLYMCYIIAN